MAELVDAAKVYSDRHSLKHLFQGLDVSELFAQPGGAGAADTLVDSTGSDTAQKSFAARCAETIAALHVCDASSPRPLPDRMFGLDASQSVGAPSVAPGGGPSSATTLTAGDRTLPFLLADLYGAIALHYSGLTTGTGAASGASGILARGGGDENKPATLAAAGRMGHNTVNGASGLSHSPDVASLQEGLSIAFALTRTWIQVAALLWRSAITAAASNSSAGSAAPSPATAAQDGDAFLFALFSAGSSASETRAAEGIALLFAKGHMPDLPLHLWHTFLELGRAAMQLKRDNHLSASFKRLTCETVVVRSLIMVLCDMAVVPVAREVGLMAASRKESTPANAGVAAFSSPTALGRAKAATPFSRPKRVMEEIQANLALLSQENTPKGGEALRIRLAMVFADAFFLHVLKPYPSLVANSVLGMKP